MKRKPCKLEKRYQKNQAYFPKLLVVGNKGDLVKKGTKISKLDIEKLQDIKITEISALANEGIDDAFRVLLTDLHNDVLL